MITLTAEIVVPNAENIIINHRNSLSIERTTSDRSDFKLPSFGIISNSGNLQFIDSDGSIKSLAENGTLKSGMEVNIYLQNTLYSNAKINVGKYYTTKWGYDVNNKKCTVVISDGLQELQEIGVPARRYDHTKTEDRKISFKKLYGILYDLTPQKYGFLPYSELDDETKAVLNALDLGEEGYDDKPISNFDNRLDYLYWDSTNLWHLWNNFCQACFCHLYKYKGSTILKYNGGN